MLRITAYLCELGNPMRHAIALLMCLAAAAASAAPAAKTASGEPDDKVYRYTDDNGVVHYTDKPPAKDAKPVELPHIQTYHSKHINTRPAAAPPVKEAPKFELAINSPTPDQTVRSGTDIAVSVSVLPGLVEGYGLVYSLDGAPQNEVPSGETSYTLKGANRGDHTVTVALIGPKKDELASTTITVHMLPPTVNKP